jgi:RNA polymerase sigma-70 factor (ECF subfamily)
MQRITTKDRLRENEARLGNLLSQGLAGDAYAYHAFLKELSAHLRDFLRRRLVKLPDEVEDVVQESLLAVHNQRHTYDAGQPLTAWVRAIAKYMHCYEMEALFIGFWYVLGMLIPAVVGALLGPRLLRW